MDTPLTLTPIGVVTKTDRGVFIDLKDQYHDALSGLEGFSHIHVLYWFHENDTLEKRQTLTVRPRKDPANPITGVFATHSPLRPNPVALTLCRMTAVRNNRIELATIDAKDGSPVIDIKCYIPTKDYVGPVILPDWV